jgi:hypothetical protein
MKLQFFPQIKNKYNRKEEKNLVKSGLVSHPLWLGMGLRPVLG